jgi:hypothetical protein
MHITSAAREFDFSNYMNKMALRALEHAALVSRDEDAREARRAAAVLLQPRRAEVTVVGSLRLRLQYKIVTKRQFEHFPEFFRRNFRLMGC